MEYYQFRALNQEAIRQFNEQKEALQQSSLMAQVLIGFVAGFFSIIFLQDTSKNFNYFIDVFYIIEIAMAGLFGFLAYRVRDYPIGANVPKLSELVKKDKKIDARIEIFKLINLSNERNRENLLTKNKYLKAGYICYNLGLFSFVIIKLIYFLGVI